MPRKPSSTWLLGLLCLSLIAATAPPEAAEPAPEKKGPDDLAAKLIRDTVNQSTSEDPMAVLVQSMGEIAHKLQEEFDPGEQTQTQQREVMAKLDEAIKAAAARRQAKSQSQPKEGTDKRTMPAARKPQPPAEAKKPASDGSAKDSAEKSAGEAAVEQKGQQTNLSSSRRSWGHLPQRDREELQQGAQEEFLERYRPWVEQYFRTLQESNR